MRRPIACLTVLLAIIAGMFITTPWLLEGLANYLVVSDKPARVDAIVVLGGDANGERVAEAVRLYRQGYAPRLLMSGGPLVYKMTYAAAMKKQAVEAGVPASAVLVQVQSRSTIEDAKYSLPIIRDHRFKSIILVTSPTHTRRAGRVFRKILGPEKVQVLVYPVQQSSFNPRRWWTRHEDTATMVWEGLSTLFYFLKGY